MIKLSIGLGVALLVSMLAGAAGWKEARSVQEQFDAFKLTQEALAMAQERAIAAEKVKHENEIHAALSDRDAAIAKLRERQRTGAGILPPIPAGARAPETVCFERAGFDAAFRGIEGLIAEGDQAVIDDRAWLEAWPK